VFQLKQRAEKGSREDGKSNRKQDPTRTCPIRRQNQPLFEVPNSLSVCPVRTARAQKNLIEARPSPARFEDHPSGTSHGPAKAVLSVKMRFGNLRSLLLHFGFRLLAAGTIEHEHFRERSQTRDPLDELHGLPAIRTGGRSWRVGQHAAGDRLSHRVSNSGDIRRGSGRSPYAFPCDTAGAHNL
jgi:hypothetical protein